MKCLKEMSLACGLSVMLWGQVKQALLWSFRLSKACSSGLLSFTLNPFIISSSVMLSPVRNISTIMHSLQYQFTMFKWDARFFLSFPDHLKWLDGVFKNVFYRGCCHKIEFQAWNAHIFVQCFGEKKECNEFMQNVCVYVCVYLV